MDVAQDVAADLAVGRVGDGDAVADLQNRAVLVEPGARVRVWAGRRRTCDVASVSAAALTPALAKNLRRLVRISISPSRSLRAQGHPPPATGLRFTARAALLPWDRPTCRFPSRTAPGFSMAYPLNSRTMRGPAPGMLRMSSSLAAFRFTGIYTYCFRRFVSSAPMYLPIPLSNCPMSSTAGIRRTPAPSAGRRPGSAGSRPRCRRSGSRGRTPCGRPRPVARRSATARSDRRWRRRWWRRAASHQALDDGRRQVRQRRQLLLRRRVQIEESLADLCGGGEPTPSTKPRAASVTTEKNQRRDMGGLLFITDRRREYHPGGETRWRGPAGPAVAKVAGARAGGALARTTLENSAHPLSEGSISSLNSMLAR